MKKLLMNKNFVMIFGIITTIIVIVLCLTGCNKQVFDTHHTFNKIYCNYDGNQFTLDIKSWKDYEGEQIQINATDGKTYVLSTNKCYMVGE